MTSCSNNIEPFELEDEYYLQGEVIPLENYSAYKELIDNEKSFALYIYSTGCSSCYAFYDILLECIQENEFSVYALEYAFLKDNDKDIIKKIKYTPSLALYNKGKLMTYLDANSNEDIPAYTSADSLYEWISDYIIFKK